MDQTIKILEILLLISCILAVGRLYMVLNDVRQTLKNVEKNVETTSTEISGTLKRMETVAASTEHVLREEVAPTLQVARATLANLEVTTRALAEASQIARGFAGKADKVVSAQRLLSASSPLVQMVAGKAAGAAGSLLAGLGGSVLGLFRRKKHTESSEPRRLTKEERSKALPPGESPATASAGSGKSRKR